MADAATRWCVVGFIMLSGELLLSPEKHAHPNEFWAKRLHRLLPALIVWPTIYLAWRYMFWKEPLTPALIVHDLLAGRPYIHLHFMFLIAGLYLVTPLLATIVSRLTLPRFYRHLHKGENGEIGGHHGRGETTSVYRGIST
jgi:surface polysaccharide O-acyltransferase-like enzyme